MYHLVAFTSIFYFFVSNIQNCQSTNSSPLDNSTKDVAVISDKKIYCESERKIEREMEIGDKGKKEKQRHYFEIDIFLVFAITFITSCQEYVRVEYVIIKDEIEIPKRPKLPTISSNELQCLSDESYEKLKLRFHII